MYIDNQPPCNGPTGLLSGVLSDVLKLNPFKIAEAVGEPTEPPCQEVTLKVVDSNYNTSYESHYVATSDVKQIDPCYFQDKRNPARDTNNTCNRSCESFTNISFNTHSSTYPIIINIFILLIVIIFIIRCN